MHPSEFSTHESHSYSLPIIRTSTNIHKSIKMSAPKNQAAWLDKADTPLRVGDAPLPSAGPGEIVVKNAAVAINPLDWHMLDSGVFVQQWPTVFGCDVAGEVYEVGEGVTGFKKGDRVIG
jgi:NADPH:quinone reductase-like Zn-dependent oxidoreductase